MVTGWRRLTMISDDKLETDLRVNFLRYANHDRNKSTHTNPKHIHRTAALFSLES